MFGITHYSAQAGKQQVQTQCIQGDQKATNAAADAQHIADQATLAQLKQQLRQAQIAAATATASGEAAQARAAKLDASLAALRRSDASVEKWASEPLPVSLIQAEKENSSNAGASQP